MQHVLYVDSRLRTGGAHSSFSVDLRETLQLGDHGVRVDNCRLTNSFYTTDLGIHLFYKNGSGVLLCTGASVHGHTARGGSSDGDGSHHDVRPRPKFDQPSGHGWSRVAQ